MGQAPSPLLRWPKGPIDRRGGYLNRYRGKRSSGTDTTERSSALRDFQWGVLRSIVHNGSAIWGESLSFADRGRHKAIEDLGPRWWV